MNGENAERVVLCEGYYDRDFWAGWLEHLGCSGPNEGAKVTDPSGKLVVAGQFGYYREPRAFVRVVPCRGRQNVLPEACNWIEGKRNPLRHLVVCIDADTPANGSSTATGLRVEDLLREVQKLDCAKAATANEDGDVLLDEGQTKVSLVRWHVDDSATPGVPTKQTLERLVCAALVAAYPDRGKSIAAWLGGRPDAPEAGPKEHAWSHMAGWYAELGCSAFYKRLWDDPRIVAELESRLGACGAARVARALIS